MVDVDVVVDVDVNDVVDNVVVIIVMVVVNDEVEIVVVANGHFENEYENPIYGKYVRFLESMHPVIWVTWKKLIFKKVELIYEKQPLDEPICCVEKFTFDFEL